MFKKIMPKTLFGRLCLIIIFPVILLQTIAIYVFLERHWENLSYVMSESLARDIAAFLSVYETNPALAEVVAKNMNFTYTHVQSIETANIYEEDEIEKFRIILRPYLKNEFFITHEYTKADIELYIRMSDRKADSIDVIHSANSDNDNILIIIPRKRLLASTVKLVIAMTTVASIMLLMCALLLARQQINYIVMLAKAAEALGTGNAVDLVIKGSYEVRKVTIAFLKMRRRINKFIEYRTEMLACVSHDLRTPITRIKLRLAIAEKANSSASGDRDLEVSNAILRDIDEMEMMINEYLQFTQNSSQNSNTEKQKETTAHAFIQSIMQEYAQYDNRPAFTLHGDFAQMIKIRVYSLKRAISNIIHNALKFGNNAYVTIEMSMADCSMKFTIEDDGPGIAKVERKNIFRAFYQVDKNRATKGVGLGLTIARDAILAHGGSVIVEKSNVHGGCRFIVIVPV